MNKTKFSFDLDFQWSILKFIIKDKHGYKALYLIDHDYFEIDDQVAIAHALKRFFRRKKRVPSSASVLNQELNRLFKTRDYAQALLSDDKERIKRKVKKLYKSILKDGDEILEQCKQFASYVELKSVLENVHLDDFETYPNLSKKIQNAVNVGMEIDEDRGSFMVAGTKSRLIDRQSHDTIVPTPWSQMNRLTNAGGYAKGSIIVFVDRPKKGKTVLLVNAAKAYMSKKGGKKGSNKKVVYFDLENGKENIGYRIDQLMINKTKEEIKSGQYDDLLSKQYRKYKRLGGELYVIRMPNGSTTDDFQKELDDVYHEYGIKFDIALVDYAAIMGATSGAKDDLTRISDAYLDLKNFAKYNQFDHLLTAHHVVRAAYDQRPFKYETKHLAKCIDIERHVDALYGIQQNEAEEATGVFRLEVMEQRDGSPFGRVYFHANIATQKLKEFTKEQIDKYEEGRKVENQVKKKTIKRKSSIKRDL